MVRIITLTLACLTVAAAKSTGQPSVAPAGVSAAPAAAQNIAVGEPNPQAPSIVKASEVCGHLSAVKKIIEQENNEGANVHARAYDFKKHVVKYLQQEFHCADKKDERKDGETGRKGTSSSPVVQNIVAGQQQQKQQPQQAQQQQNQQQQQVQNQQNQHQQQGKETTVPAGSSAAPTVSNNAAKVVVVQSQQQQQQQQKQSAVFGQKQNELHVAVAVTSTPANTVQEPSTTAKSGGLGAFFGFRR